MFVLGLWMVTLDYYSPYYRLAPDIHRSVGMLLLILLVVRFAWRLGNRQARRQRAVAVRAPASRIVHWGFYPLLFALMASGYLISTADGRPIEVFDWFSVPALVQAEGPGGYGGRGARDPRLRDDGHRRRARRGLPQASFPRPQPHPDAHVVGSAHPLS